MKSAMGLLLFGAVLASATSASAQTLEWSSVMGGPATLTVNSSSWNTLYGLNNPTPVATSSVGSPSGTGQRLRAVVTSNFLFTSRPAGFHFVVALNYAPVYSYSDWSWTYSYMGNQASAITLGEAQNPNQDGPCPSGARFEAIYQVPNYAFYSWYPYGVTTGANGQPNALAGCVPLLSGPPTWGSSDHQMYFDFSSRYDGGVSMMTAPSPGSFIIATGTSNWGSWFDAAAGVPPSAPPGSGMLRHSGVGVAPVGEFPPNSYIRIELLSLEGF